LAKESETCDDEQAHKLMDKAVSSLVEIHRNTGASNAPQTRDEFAREELAKLDRKGSELKRVSLPFKKLEAETGPFIPGDLVGISAYSNGGKSLTLANLFRWFVIQGYPCIVFPTEMRERWLSRAFAAHARVSQRLAEREEWDLATDQQKEDYRFAVQDLAACPWEVVNRPRISPAEIMARASVLRRKYAGKPVVVMIDHMHRLDYGTGKAEIEVGGATRRLRDWAASDTEGGIVLVVLYQPRKPEDDAVLYRPVRGYQIKGVSEVWNEMDIHISPYRRWVKVVPGWEKNQMLRTSWGTPSCLYSDKHPHIPEFAKPGDESGKLDDEHCYIKVDKRRVGGEGPTVMLEIDSPSGRIYELERQYGVATVGGGA
jgi:hypothetical protein